MCHERIKACFVIVSHIPGVSNQPVDIMTKALNLRLFGLQHANLVRQLPQD